MTEQRQTKPGLDRLANFSDATVAIGITVPTLPLVDLAGELTAGKDAGNLSANTGRRSWSPPSPSV